MNDCPRCGHQRQIDFLNILECPICGLRDKQPVAVLPSPALCEQQRDWYTDVAALMADVPMELFEPDARVRLVEMYQQAKNEAEEWDNLLQDRKRK